MAARGRGSTRHPGATIAACVGARAGLQATAEGAGSWPLSSWTCTAAARHTWQHSLLRLTPCPSREAEPGQLHDTVSGLPCQSLTYVGVQMTPCSHAIGLSVPSTWHKCRLSTNLYKEGKSIPLGQREGVASPMLCS